MIIYKQFMIRRYLFRSKIVMQGLFRTAYVIGKGYVVLDGHAEETILKKMTAPRVLIVIPPDKSGSEALEEAG